MTSIHPLRLLRRQFLGASLAGLLSLAATPVWAQVATTAAPAAGTQPALRLIVPFTPGTGIDLVARTVGPRLSERLGRPVVVDNRAGASGNIGTELVVRAPPNGNTLLVSVISSITPTMLRLPNGASTRAPMSDSRASSQR